MCDARAAPPPLAQGKGKKEVKVKRPPSAYILYCNSRREKVTGENPGASMIEITKILAQKWKDISDERKAKYEAQAKELKAEYDAKMAKVRLPLAHAVPTAPAPLLRLTRRWLRVRCRGRRRSPRRRRRRRRPRPRRPRRRRRRPRRRRPRRRRRRPRPEELLRAAVADDRDDVCSASPHAVTRRKMVPYLADLPLLQMTTYAAQPMLACCRVPSCSLGAPSNATERPFHSSSCLYRLARQCSPAREGFAVAQEP